MKRRAVLIPSRRKRTAHTRKRPTARSEGPFSRLESTAFFTRSIVSNVSLRGRGRRDGATELQRHPVALADRDEALAIDVTTTKRGRKRPHVLRMIACVARVRVDLRALDELEARRLRELDHRGLRHVATRGIDLCTFGVAVLDHAEDPARAQHAEHRLHHLRTHAVAHPTVRVAERDHHVRALRRAELDRFGRRETTDAHVPVELGMLRLHRAKTIAVRPVRKPDRQRARVAEQRREELRVPAATGRELDHVLAGLDLEERERLGGMTPHVARTLFFGAVRASHRGREVTARDVVARGRGRRIRIGRGRGGRGRAAASERDEGREENEVSHGGRHVVKG